MFYVAARKDTQVELEKGGDAAHSCMHRCIRHENPCGWLSLLNFR